MSLPVAPRLKPLSLTEMQNRARGFVARWKGEQRENAEAQTWWNDFFDIFGVTRREVATFERWATRASTGNRGRIDVFMPGVMLAEHKSLGKDEGRGSAQAEDYLRGGDIGRHEWPRYLVSCDFDIIVLDDLETTDPPLEFKLSQLPKYVQRFAFLGGYEAPRRLGSEGEAVSVKAARDMGELYEALLGDVDPEDDSDFAEQAAIFMTRILFLLYGDDVVGLWEEGLFERFIRNHTVEDGSDTGAQIAYLFQVLDTPPDRRRNLPDDVAAFPYVNGGLFTQRIDIPTFDRSMRDALVRAVGIDWSGISPAIFGSLFQALSSREERRKQGEHYTTETNILKTLRPLFLDEFEERLQRAWTSRGELEKLHAAIGTYRYLDPACGCGNFLIIAYREMADIEFRIIRRIRELKGETMDYAMDATWELKVRPEQFGGIEINWWPAKIAETAMFLMQHKVTQRLGEIGSPPSILPITDAAHIIHGNALTTSWEDALPLRPGRTIVFGNPPFLGDHTRTAQQLAEMRAAWGNGKVLSRLDFVTSWHAIALRFFEQAEGDWAFVTTNSIVQGDQAPRLFRPIFEAGWRIKFAHRTFAWTSEASGKAAVHCVIIGFTRDPSSTPRLFDYPTLKSDPVEIPARLINAYLVDGPNVLVEKRSTPLSPELPEVYYGSKPTDGGHLIVTPDEYNSVAADPVMAKYLRPYVGSDELLYDRKRWCLWLRDMDPDDPRRSPELERRIKAVEQMRLDSKAASTRDYARFPHLFRQLGLISPATFIGIPEVSSEIRRYLPIAYLPPETIISNKVYGAVDDGGILFGIASSSMFITWMKTVGGRLESRLSFSSTVTWNNFPLPDLTDTQRDGIVTAGRAVRTARELHPERSLAQHYNPLTMDPALVKAHDRLDTAVDKVMGARKRCSTERERQHLLFESYARMIV